MNRTTCSALFAFTAAVVVCVSAAAATVLPARAADATDLGIVDVVAVMSAVDVQ